MKSEFSLVNRLEALLLVAQKGGDRALYEEIFEDLSGVRAVVSRLTHYDRRATRSVLARKLDKMTHEAAMDALSVFLEGGNE